MSAMARACTAQIAAVAVLAVWVPQDPNLVCALSFGAAGMAASPGTSWARGVPLAAAALGIGIATVIGGSEVVLAAALSAATSTVHPRQRIPFAALVAIATGGLLFGLVPVWAPTTAQLLLTGLVLSAAFPIASAVLPWIPMGDVLVSERRIRSTLPEALQPPVLRARHLVARARPRIHRTATAQLASVVDLLVDLQRARADLEADLHALQPGTGEHRLHLEIERLVGLVEQTGTRLDEAVVDLCIASGRARAPRQDVLGPLLEQALSARAEGLTQLEMQRL